jgi:hypothetical protein
VKEERKILGTTKIRNFNRIVQIRRRNCILEHLIAGKIEGRIYVSGG